jgi:spore germination protein KC
MKTRILLLTVSLLLSFVLPGCWDYNEYEDLAQLVAMGLDYDTQSRNITISVQYPAIRKAKGAGGETPGPLWVVHSATDKNLFGALTKLDEVVPEKLFYGYIKIVIVGEEAAKHNIMELIDLFDRTPVIRTSAYLVIAEGKAEDVIKDVTPSQRSSTETVDKLVGTLRDAGTGYPVTVNDFLEMLAVGGWEAVAPRIISVGAEESTNSNNGGKQNKGKQGKENKDKQGKGDNGGSDESMEAKGDRDAEGDIPGHMNLYLEHPGGQRVGGMAAFQGDKFLGWLNDRESRGLGLIRAKNLHSYKISEPIADTGLEELYYRLLSTDSKIKVRIENNQPVVTVNIKVVADLRKYYRNEGSDFLFPEQKRHLEQKLTESIRFDIDAALRRGQKELKTDIFGFGFALFRTDPKLWQQEYAEKWADIYPDIPVNVNVEAKVINTGVNIRKLFIK